VHFQLQSKKGSALELLGAPDPDGSFLQTQDGTLMIAEIRNPFLAIELLQSTPWIEFRFELMDAYRVPALEGYSGIGRILPGDEPPADAEVVKGAWDHEHCEICWTHIRPGHKAYYTCPSFLCKRCYKRHVEAGDLSFLVG
jgi:hypothetical protein